MHVYMCVYIYIYVPVHVCLTSEPGLLPAQEHGLLSLLPEDGTDPRLYAPRLLGLRYRGSELRGRAFRGSRSTTGYLSMVSFAFIGFGHVRHV